ncbi:MAG: hypothetical protein A3H98_14590 [Bacteroidetes bacterium RIFCSPLOWO2_02_FULL_36_8]|nr:MAG: hypothetical protein A3H98_14590 [Bacteroidetes bacterium RIFCSPLOWO2_02_FULL_36_8]OFY72137.1 MAG: hypothetical protein A3G23_07185 [Bacteroidetes bacterium RIFCSPLOWO2_12_FULL_37_12]
MKKFTFIVIITLFSCSYAISQQWLWTKSFGSSKNDKGLKFCSDSEENLFVTGYFADTLFIESDTFISKGGNSDIFIMKFDSSGKYIWGNSGGGLKNDAGLGIDVDKDGNVYIAGYIQSSVSFDNITLNSLNGKDIVLLKYNTNGKCVWAKTVVGSGDDYAYGIAVNKKSIYVVGEFASEINFGSGYLLRTISNNTDMFEARYDTGGNFISAHQSVSVCSDYFSGVFSDKEGNIYFTGKTQGTEFMGCFIGAYNPSYPDLDESCFIAKYDSLENCLWTKSFTSNSWSGTTSASIDVQGNVYVTGYFIDTLIINNIIIPSLGEKDVATLKFDSNGNLIWIKCGGGGELSSVPFENQYFWGDIANSISVNKNGDTFITGFFNSSAKFGTFNLATTQYFADMFIVSYDATGKELWATSEEIKDHHGAGKDIIAKHDNVIYVLGYFEGEATFGNKVVKSKGSLDFFISKIKYDMKNNVINEDFNSNVNNLKVYPNPTDKSLIFSLNQPIDFPLEVKIFDVTGKVISEANDINKNIFVFNTEYFTKGLYFYKLYNNRKKAIGTGKFFIQ